MPRTLLNISLLAFLSLFGASFINAQEYKRSDCLGRFYYNQIQGAKLYEQEDGTMREGESLVIASIQYELKRFGRLTVIKHPEYRTEKEVLKGKWKLQNDTLILTYDDFDFKYRIISCRTLLGHQPRRIFIRSSASKCGRRRE